MSIRFRIKQIWNGLLFQLSFFLLAFYLIMGLLFLFSDIWADIVPKRRDIIGITLLVFGSLRFYVAYRRYKIKHEKLQDLKKAKKTLEESHHVEVQ